MRVALASLLVACASVPPVANVENAAAVAQYTTMLEHCRERGKAAGSYAVYQACADAVDRELCARQKLRCSP